ncbi:MAG: S-adenosylmethionine:tRNA ribosyltransferase-isomerase [Bacteroidales bacterium]|nr:S-adenosylmethionine:tRNA ribosyltransferase-isomerase [Bacteroidales bacterium]
MMSAVKDINIEAYDYPLPEERIAKYPLSERDASQLLVLKHNQIDASQFKHIGDFLPKDTLLVFNETKVIRARLQFHKTTGPRIEVFCLEPEKDYQVAFSATSPVRWKCLIGNAKRWKEGALSMELKIGDEKVVLCAERISQNVQYAEIEFSWTPEHLPFASVLEAAGEIPLPPYLHRDAEPDDRDRYQTVFARYNGSVAAPTAGLHFTQPLIAALREKGFSFDEVTLHVGAGTFKPVSTETIGEHAMHSETIIIRKSLIQNLVRWNGKPVVPVGTTSTRTLESLYWIGLMLHEQGMDMRPLHVEQWFPYEDHKPLSTTKALQLVLNYLERHGLTRLEASTALMIAPSYKMRVVTGLITNFHQPKSTLLLLVSALIGERWKDCYRFALDHDFRFLSYGDSCLFLP